MQATTIHQEINYATLEYIPTWFIKTTTRKFIVFLVTIKSHIRQNVVMVNF